MRVSRDKPVLLDGVLDKDYGAMRECSQPWYNQSNTCIPLMRGSWCSEVLLPKQAKIEGPRRLSSASTVVLYVFTEI